MRFWVLLLGFAAAVGCGDDPLSPLDARKELAGLGFDFTTDAFFEAALKGDLTAVKLFVDAGMSVHITNEGITVLHGAAVGGHLEVVKYLVGQGADVNATSDEGITPLMMAVLGPFWDPETSPLVETGEVIPLGDHGAVEQYLIEQGAKIHEDFTLAELRAVLLLVLLSD